MSVIDLQPGPQVVPHVPENSISPVSHNLTYGSGLGDGHEHDNLPTLLTGGGSGLFKHGRHIKYKNETPLANLHLVMMDRMGVPADSFADSNGKLGYLADL